MAASVDIQAPEAAPRTCDTPGCGLRIQLTSKSGLCAKCAQEAYIARKGAQVPVDTPRSRADAVVDAWARADYERDDVDPSFMSERSLEALALRIEAVYQGQGFPPPVPLKGTKAAKWLDKGIVTAGTPREMSPDTDDPSQRAPTCVAFTRCAAIAAEKGWAAWSCRACDGPGSLSASQGLRPGEPPRDDLTPYGRPKRAPRRGGRLRLYENKGWG